jgi:hypothetical protein
MWVMREKCREWCGDGITVIDDGTWWCVKKARGYHGLPYQNTVRFKELAGLLQYLAAVDLRHLGWTPLVILSLSAGSPYELQAGTES